MNLANQPSIYMSYEELFDHSYERVKNLKKNGRPFFAAFYDNFLQSSPIVAEHFSSTDMEQQMKMMEKSFYGLFIFYATQNANDYLDSIAQRHSHGDLAIDPQLYDFWLDSLINTVRDYDPQYNNEIALAWRIILSPGVTYMKHRYNG